MKRRGKDSMSVRESIIHVLFLLCLESCAMKKTTLLIEGVKYSFPPDEVINIIDRSQGHLYVRTSPKKANYDLIYSEIDKGQTDKKTGKQVVSFVSNSPDSSLEVINIDGMQVLCSEFRTSFNCGFNISDNGITWSVIFNKSEISHIKRISSQSIKVIRGYRG